MAYYTLDGIDRKKAFYVLHERQGRNINCRAEYADLKCLTCGRIDFLRALSKGISDQISVPNGLPDLAWSDEGLLTVSARGTKVICAIPNVAVDLFKIPGTDRHIIYPQKMFGPPKGSRRYEPDEPRRLGDPFQVRSRPCKGCGRLLEVTWFWKWYEIPEHVPFAGVLIEKQDRESTAIVVSEQVVAQLNAKKLSGWKTLPIRGCALDPEDAKIAIDPSDNAFPIYDRKKWLARKKQKLAAKTRKQSKPTR